MIMVETLFLPVTRIHVHLPSALKSLPFAVILSEVWSNDRIAMPPGWILCKQLVLLNPATVVTLLQIDRASSGSLLPIGISGQ